MAWELFSLVYYGQLVPNTALAKLPPGVPVGDLAAQGLRYLAATWHFDAVTPLVILASTILLAWIGGLTGRAIAAGIVLHVLSIVAVGGDFMSGRFLTPAFLMGVVGVTSMRGGPRSGGALIMAGAALMVIGAFEPGTPFRTTASFRPSEELAAEFARHGVTDERRFYYPTLGLLPVLQGRASPRDHTWAAAGLAMRAEPDGPEHRVRPASNVGLFGYFAGPGVYVIDRNALTDPFLARLPPKSGWRVGHYERAVPPEYEASRRADRNLMSDPDLRRLYDDVETLARADIWSRQRFGVIVRLLR
jgi:arabinofuranosyltransferase